MSFQPLASLSSDYASCFATVILGSVAYGAHIVVAGVTTESVYKQPNRKQVKRLLAFIALLFILGTINFGFFVASETIAFTGAHNPYMNCVHDSKIAALLTALFTQSFLIYRCYIIWHKRWLIVVIPVILLLGELVLAVIQIARPQSLLEKNGIGIIVLSIMYWSLSLTLNVLLTVLIAGRIYYMGRRFNSLLGTGTENMAMYRGIIAILVESSLLYTFVAIFGYAFQPRDMSVENTMFSPLLSQVECIATDLILLRVSRRQLQLLPSVQPGSSLKFKTQLDPLESLGTLTTNTIDDKIGA